MIVVIWSPKLCFGDLVTKNEKFFVTYWTQGMKIARRFDNYPTALAFSVSLPYKADIKPLNGSNDNG